MSIDDFLITFWERDIYLYMQSQHHNRHYLSRKTSSIGSVLLASKCGSRSFHKVVRRQPCLRPWNAPEPFGSIGYLHVMCPAHFHLSLRIRRTMLAGMNVWCMKWNYWFFCHVTKSIVKLYKVLNGFTYKVKFTISRRRISFCMFSLIVYILKVNQGEDNMTLTFLRNE